MKHHINVESKREICSFLSSIRFWCINFKILCAQQLYTCMYAHTYMHIHTNRSLHTSSMLYTPSKCHKSSTHWCMNVHVHKHSRF